MEHFSRVAGRNFTKIDVKVFKVSLQDNFVLEFRKVAPFLHNSCRQNNKRKMLSSIEYTGYHFALKRDTVPKQPLVAKITADILRQHQIPTRPRT